ncbi:MAG TPA: glycosyltransferase family 4 protein [Dokdonella sp.]
MTTAPHTIVRDATLPDTAARPRECAVISLLNTPAGLFRWYEEFPQRISGHLQEAGIDHIVGYKSYLDNTTIPAHARLTAHDETDMVDPAWVSATLGPIVARYRRVIVHTHSYAFGECAVWRLCRTSATRSWWATMHRTPRPGSGLRALSRRVLQYGRCVYPDRLFGCSSASQQALQAMFIPSRVGLLRNGRLSDGDMQMFPPRAQPCVALFVGRLTREKGVFALLQAAAILASQHPRFRLLIVGDGPEEAAMRQWIAAQRLEATIDMLGYRADVETCYAQADFLIIPTDPALVAEGLPLVALEAKAFALPVIYSRSGGLPESQVEGETGIVVDPPDAPDIARAAAALMGDVERYHAMRESIRRERVRWGIDAMAQAYVREYQAAFGRR